MNVSIISLFLIICYTNECFGYALRRTGHNDDDREMTTDLMNLKDINTKLHETQVMLMMKKLRPKRDAMDNLIYEVVADTEKDELETDYDKSNFKAESIRHRLNERIEHIDLVLTHLKDIKKHFESVHKMAKTLVESDATADFVKKFAIDQLNDSVNNVEKCDQCWT